MNSLAAPLYVVTGVLVIAGFAKLVRPAATATALRAISVPAPITVTRLLGAFEVSVGFVAVATGNPIAWAGVAITYTSFVGFILWALQAEANVGSCGCFGRDDTPPTAGHAAFNAAAAAMATIVVFDPVELGDFDGSTFEAVLLLLLIGLGTGLAVLALTALPRTLSIANGVASPAIATFSVESAHPLSDEDNT